MKGRSSKIEHKCYVSGIADESARDAWFTQSNKKKIFYVYVKTRPDGHPFWVGKGFGYRAFSVNGRNKFYKNILNKYGYKNVKTTIFPLESEEKAFSEEIRLTAYFKALGCKLANLTGGGEGPSGLKPTEEANEKRRLAMFGFKHTNESKEKIRISKLGIKQVPLSIEHKQKLSVIMTGKKKPLISEETREKQRLSHLGKKMPREVREKIRLSNTGKKYPNRKIIRKEIF